MRRCAAMILLLGVLLAGCGGRAAAPEVREATVFAMDTVMNLRVYGGGDALLDAARAEITRLEGRFSVTDPDSDISAVNRDGAAAVSDDTAALLGRALEVCASTGGALDVSVYPVLRAWGFTVAGGEYTVPDPAVLAALLEQVDYRRVRLDGNRVSLDPGMMIDLGSVAKGYTGDRLLALLREAGVASALLDLGGNVQALGTKPDGSPWRVAIQDPDGQGLAGVLEIADEAVITSGGYERCFVQDGVTYWHILDPATGSPARSGVLSVTVVGREGVLCDALSTALFVLGPEKAADYWRTHEGFDLVLIGEDGSLTVTEGLADRFTPTGDYKSATLSVLRKL